MESTSLLSPDIELIAEEGGSPIAIDLFDNHRHLGIFASTGSGKKVLALDILTHALEAGIPVFALDFPRIDGKSTLRGYTHAQAGEHTNIFFEDGNLFEMADFSALEPWQEPDCRHAFIDNLAITLLGMVVGDSDDPCLNAYCELILRIALKNFFDAPSIQERYSNAIEGAIGSKAWADTPTLRDFLPFCTPESLVVEGDPQKISQACEIITQRLTFWLTSRVGKAIASPSTKQTSANLRVFAVREDLTADEQLILQLAALNYILRSACLTRQSIVFISSLSRLCSSHVLSNLIANLCACGAKFGIRVMLMDQSISSISASGEGQRIFQNLETILVGRTTPAEIQTLATVLGLPSNLVCGNTLQSFSPHKQDGYSKWLISKHGKHTFVRHYPSEALLELSHP
jgi:hypothetical protein